MNLDYLRKFRRWRKQQKFTGAVAHRAIDVEFDIANVVRHGGVFNAFAGASIVALMEARKEAERGSDQCP